MCESSALPTSARDHLVQSSCSSPTVSRVPRRGTAALRLPGAAAAAAAATVAEACTPPLATPPPSPTPPPHCGEPPRPTQSRWHAETLVKGGPTAGGRRDPRGVRGARGACPTRRPCVGRRARRAASPPGGPLTARARMYAAVKGSDGDAGGGRTGGARWRAGGGHWWRGGVGGGSRLVTGAAVGRAPPSRATRPARGESVRVPSPRAAAAAARLKYAPAEGGGRGRPGDAPPRHTPQAPWRVVWRQSPPRGVDGPTRAAGGRAGGERPVLVPPQTGRATTARRSTWGRARGRAPPPPLRPPPSPRNAAADAVDADVVVDAAAGAPPAARKPPGRPREPRLRADNGADWSAIFSCTAARRPALDGDATTTGGRAAGMRRQR